jgi:hypothetical protein
MARVPSKQRLGFRRLEQEQVVQSDRCLRLEILRGGFPYGASLSQRFWLVH